MTHFSEVLENNLLPVAKNSDKVCELLIQCMDYIRKSMKRKEDTCLTFLQIYQH